MFLKNWLAILLTSDPAPVKMVEFLSTTSFLCQLDKYQSTNWQILSQNKADPREILKVLTNESSVLDSFKAL